MHEYRDSDVRRMWARRSWLLVIQCAVQGAQYAIRPDLSLNSPSFLVLRPLGLPGWRVVGVALVALALWVGVVQLATDRRRSSPEARALAYTVLGLFLGMLFMATLLNRFTIATTLILPFGLCLSELDEFNLIRTRRRRSGTRPRRR